MTPMLRSEEVCHEVMLLLNLGEIFRETALLLRDNETERHLKRFYSHLMALCLLVTGHVNRIKGALRPDNLLIRRILDIFQSLIAVRIGQELSSIPSCTLYPHLMPLSEQWRNIANQTSDAKLNFIRQCIDFGSNPAKRDNLTEFLENWVDEFLKRYPDDLSKWSKDDYMQQRKKRSEPSYAIGASAKALYEALLASKNCTCHPAHDFGARLYLCTYRKSDLRDKDEVEENFDFDMLLAAEKFWRDVPNSWQEVQIHMKKEPMVKFILNSELEQATAEKPKAARKRVKELCKEIEKMRTMSPYRRLKFEVEDRRLWKLQSEERKSPFDWSKSPVSLERFIEESSYTLTDKTKRILAVLLSYAVLHLYGTPWLQSSWGSSNIVFLQTKTSSIPLKPFIQAQLIPDRGSTPWVTSKAVQCDDNEDLDPDDIDPDGVDPDDQYSYHQCPCLVTSAIMLMEIYLATPFSQLAAKYDVQLSDGSDNTLRYLEVLQVFKNCESEILENTQFRFVLNNCLDLNLWKDQSNQPLDDPTLRNVIYQEVVRPLEDELNDAFSCISIEELDSIAQDLDLSWGQTIRNQHLINTQHAIGSNQPQEALVTPKPSQFLARFPQNIHHQKQVWAHRGTDGLHMAQNVKYEARRDSNYTSMEFFDDESRPEEISNDQREHYQNWKDRFLHIYENFITKHLDGKDPAVLVKIAVLDTGIDFLHPEIEGCEDRINGVYNFVNDKYRENVQDRDGHGTHVAGLLLSYAQDSQLYVAKIADKKPSDPGIIAKAINHAINTWKVDIISMSFGFPDCNIPNYSDLEQAIHDAYSKRILLFAAASNSGANLLRAYPARHEQVICIHSTDSKGNRSNFSPTAMGDDNNFATIGEAVESAWPMHLSSTSTNNSLVMSKSGTSFATPIAAGIAAFLLQYAWLHLSTEQATKLKNSSAMKAVLRRIAAKRDGGMKRDGYDYVEISPYQDNLFGKPDSYVKQEIWDVILNS